MLSSKKTQEFKGQNNKGQQDQQSQIGKSSAERLSALLLLIALPINQSRKNAIKDCSASFPGWPLGWGSRAYFSVRGFSPMFLNERRS